MSNTISGRFSLFAKNSEVIKMRINWKRILFLIGITLSVYVCFRYLLPFFLPILVAWLLAALLHRPVRWLKNKLRIPMTFSAVVGILLLLGAAGTGGFFLLRTLLNQLIGLIRQFPTYQHAITTRYQSFCSGCDRFLRLDTGASQLFLDAQLEQVINHIQNTVLPSITEQTLRLALGTAEVFALIVIILVVAILLVKDLDRYRERFRASAFAPILLPVTDRLRYSAVAYLRTQGIIMLITAVLCTLGLALIKNPYALLLGLAIALLDALPVLGSGMILLPWSIVLFFQKNYMSGAILLTVFVLCVILREFLEPKLLGKGIGIRPLYTLISMYLGIRIFGVAGFILGPIGLVIIKSLYETTEAS